MNKRHQKNISYGIIAFKLIENKPVFCMVCRKDSFSLSELLRGKYELEDVQSIKRMLKYMTKKEYESILKDDFETLWDRLWVLDKRKIYSNKFKRDFNQSKYKFETLRKGYQTTVPTDLGIKSKQFIKLSNLIEEIRTAGTEIYEEPEWGFPKGKKNENESDFECAKREFFEETNVPIDKLQFHNVQPLVEKFIADNLQEYIHIYYVAQCPSELELSFDKNNDNQLLEISNIKWFTFEKAMEVIRDYNDEKRNVLRIVHDVINQTILKST